MMGVSVLLKAPTDTKVVPFDSTDSPLATSSSETDIDPNFLSDNSEVATNGSSKVKRDARGWTRSAILLLRGSKTRLEKLRRETAGSLDSSSSDGEGVRLDSSNSSSVVSTSEAPSEADLETCQQISEEATNESSSTIKRDGEGGRGWTGSLLRGSKKFLAELRPDRGKELPNSEERRRQECASKLEEDPTHAQEEGPERNLVELTVVQDDELPVERGQLEGQEEPVRHIKRGSTRAMKGYISMPKSVKQLRKTKSDEYCRKVVVNGVRIKDVDVKKAEELAGPIHPGDYWYDIQAGFWGVDPGPCLGIIPPCIMELNITMCKSCSGGNTGILVNGRELHEKDLERLSFRGLPPTPGMAYCISIDGRVTDESSRKYVTCLGMLAPSLGKYGRGSGIYTPALY